MMKVDESDSLVQIDVFRYGPMSDPITLRVTDIPLTAKRGELARMHLPPYSCKDYCIFQEQSERHTVLFMHSSELIHKVQTLYETGS